MYRMKYNTPTVIHYKYFGAGSKASRPEINNFNLASFTIYALQASSFLQHLEVNSFLNLPLSS